MRTLAVALLASLAFAGVAVAGDVSPQAEIAIEKKLTAAGCKLADVDATSTGYVATNAECSRGVYTITLDKNYNIQSKTRQ